MDEYTLAKMVKYKPPEITFTCEFCKKSFAKERTLESHTCEQRRRHMQRDKPEVRIAFQCYLHFYKNITQTKTYEDFRTSHVYGAYVKFGQYCVDNSIINSVRFSEWLLKKNKPIDYWCKDSNYTAFLIEYLQLESVNDALTRAIEYSIEWGESHNQPAKDVLRFNGNEAKLLVDITKGKLSPWVLYASESGQRFLAELDVTQQRMIWDYINVDIWSKKLKDAPDDLAFAREVLQKAGW